MSTGILRPLRKLILMRPEKVFAVNNALVILKNRKTTRFVFKCIRYKNFTDTMYIVVVAISPVPQNVFAFAEILLVTMASVTAALEENLFLSTVN